jgi:hypothetical protein
MVGREARGAEDTGATADGEPKGDGGCAMAHAQRALRSAQPRERERGEDCVRCRTTDGARAGSIVASGAASHATLLL